MRTLSGSERRTVGIALAVLVPALLWVGVGQPLVTALGDRRAALASERAALARERALVAAAPRNAVVRRALDSLIDATSGRLLDAKDDAIAGAELSGYVARAARAHHVLLTAAETQGATTSRAGVRSIAVVVRGESDFQGVVDFLRALEGGERLVRVDGVTLSRAQADDDAPDADPHRAHVVRLRATVVGFALAPVHSTPVRPAPIATGAAVAGQDPTAQGVAPRRVTPQRVAVQDMTRAGERAPVRTP